MKLAQNKIYIKRRFFHILFLFRFYVFLLRVNLAWEASLKFCGDSNNWCFRGSNKLLAYGCRRILRDRFFQATLARKKNVFRGTLIREERKTWKGETSHLVNCPNYHSTMARSSRVLLLSGNGARRKRATKVQDRPGPLDECHYKDSVDATSSFPLSNLECSLVPFHLSLFHFLYYLISLFLLGFF